MTPFLGSISLLEQLRELRETLDELDHQFIEKGCNPTTTKPRMQRSL